MPWKGEKDPYKIWLSEIILQQTRVEQGWSYYEKFIKSFPSIDTLAKAPEKKVYKLWEGLGYYTRCRNLIQTARKISSDNAGHFPSTYEDIVNLKGIGPYTASAIASFAFNLPYAVVDSNVKRVLARYFGISTPIDSANGMKFYSDFAATLLDQKRPGIYNQAIMDFGAVVCKPKNPCCHACILSVGCQAFKHNWVTILPNKGKRPPKERRWFYYLVIQTLEKNYYIRQRKGKDIWQNLYEFVLWESDQPIGMDDFAMSDFMKDVFGKHPFTIRNISKIYKQQLTHQTIQGRFLHIEIKKPLSRLKEYKLIKPGKIREYPFPKFINEYLPNLL
jgi:A/G-specific adenine glycosylase